MNRNYGFKYTAQAVSVSISGTTARSALLPVGRYKMVSDVDCYLQQGDVTIEATTADTLWTAGDHGEDREGLMVVDTADNGYVAAITGGATGTLKLTRVGGWV